MNRKNIILSLVAGTLVVAVVIAAFTFRSAGAQAPTPTPNTPDSQPAQPPAGKGFHGGMGMKMGFGYNVEDVANALGITVEQFQTAQQTATEEALQQAVSAGLITQAQADALLARGAVKFHADGLLAANGIDYNALLAQALNISVDELQAAYQTAHFAAIDRAVQDGNLTQEQADLAKGRYALGNNTNFRNSMQSAFEAAVQQAVTDGVITQAQADQILENNAGMGLPFPGLKGPGDFGGPGFGGHHHWKNGAPANPNRQEPTTQPSTNGV